MIRPSRSFLFVLAGLLAAGPMLAQIDVLRGGDRQVLGVTLFSRPDFAGPGYFFHHDIERLDAYRFDDEASSVRVDPGCEVRLYADPHFRGRAIEVRGDATSLARSVGNGEVSSLRVRCGRDSWGDDGGWQGGDRDEVTLYRDLRFTGVSQTFTEDVRDLRGSRVGNDEVTSVRVSRGCRARLYEHPDFAGRYTELDGDAPDLRGSTVGDDRISSLRVDCRRGPGWGGGWGSDRGVTLHRDLSFTGVSETFDRDVPNLHGSRVGNDEVTSVSVPRGCRVRLYEHPDYRGNYTELSRDDPDLRGSRVGDDAVSSLRVDCGRY